MKRTCAFLLLLLFSFGTFACTTFFINHNGQMVFGRNYDWITGSGMICTNQKGLYKTSAKTQDGSSISWVSKYGSITFNQYGKEFPTGGMNEKGLVVELMWLDETKYPSPDKRPSLGVLQWIQYQLDNCATIEDVIATDKMIRIASKGTAPLHYLIADASGNSATIEFLNGKMVVNKGTDLPVAVLTNSIYKESVQLTKPGINVSYANNSIDRFARACYMIEQLNKFTPGVSLVNYSFDILKRVAQGPATQWSIVYDITNMKIYFKTNSFQETKNISFSGFDFSCNAASYSLDMNQSMNDDVRKKFLNFSIELNRKIVERSLIESASRIHVGDAEKEEGILYPSSIKCRE